MITVILLVVVGLLAALGTAAAARKPTRHDDSGDAPDPPKDVDARAVLDERPIQVMWR